MFFSFIELNFEDWRRKEYSKVLFTIWGTNLLIRSFFHFSVLTVEIKFLTKSKEGRIYFVKCQVEWVKCSGVFRIVELWCLARFCFFFFYIFISILRKLWKLVKMALAACLGPPTLSVVEGHWSARGTRLEFTSALQVEQIIRQHTPLPRTRILSCFFSSVYFGYYTIFQFFFFWF